MLKWQAIIFDLDDTLYPERDYVLSGFRFVAQWASQNIEIPEKQGYQKLISLYEKGVRGNTFNHWLDSYEKSNSFIPNLVEVYRQHIPELTPYPAIRKLLPKLKKCAKIGLVSDGYLEVQRRKFTSLALSEYFDAVVFSDEFGRESWKPSSFPFQQVLAKLNTTSSHSVYVGDNPMKDFLGARNVGISTIWARYSGGDYTTLRPPTQEYAADFEVNDIDTLEAWLMPPAQKLD